MPSKKILFATNVFNTVINLIAAVPDWPFTVPNMFPVDKLKVKLPTAKFPSKVVVSTSALLEATNPSLLNWVIPLPSLCNREFTRIAALLVKLFALVIVKVPNCVVPPKIPSITISPVEPAFNVSDPPSIVDETVISFPPEVNDAVLFVPLMVSAPPRVISPLVVMVKSPDTVDAFKVNALLSTKVTSLPDVMVTSAKSFAALSRVMLLLEPAAKVDVPVISNTPLCVNAPPDVILKSPDKVNAPKLIAALLKRDG